MLKLLLYLFPSIRAKIRREIITEIAGKLSDHSYYFNSYPEVKNLLQYISTSYKQLGYCESNDCRKYFENDIKRLYNISPRIIKTPDIDTSKIAGEHKSKKTQYIQPAKSTDNSNLLDGIILGAAIDSLFDSSDNNDNSPSPSEPDNNFSEPDNNNSFGGGGAGGEY